MTGLGMVSVRDTAREMTAMVIVSHVDPRKWCQRRVPVWHQFQLALYPTASVLRLYVELLDDPEAPFCMETFFNVEEPDQLRGLQELAKQSLIDLDFYDAACEYVFTKRLHNGKLQREQLGQLIWQALRHHEGIPESQRDFDEAKLQFQRDYPFASGYQILGG